MKKCSYAICINVRIFCAQWLLCIKRVWVFFITQTKEISLKKVILGMFLIKCSKVLNFPNLVRRRSFWMYLDGTRFASFGQIRHSKNCMSAFFFFFFLYVILWIKFLALRRSVCWLHCCMYVQLIKSAKHTVPRSLLSTELRNKASVTVKDLKIVRDQTETSRLWYLWNFRKVACIRFGRRNIVFIS